MSRADRPWSHDIPDGPWDYVVIGTGMGGMTSAATLAKLGKKVLVIERHAIPGGFTQTFKRPGYQWDVGVHIVGEMSDQSYPGRLLTDLTGGALEWEPVGQIYDEFNFPDGFTIQFPDTPQDFRETLVEYFPDERDAIDTYLEMVKHASRSAAQHFRLRALPSLLARGRKRAEAAAMPYFSKTVPEVLGELTDDVRLQAVLAAQWGYYTSTPREASFAMHALMVQHFRYGAYYPAGTAEQIAWGLLQPVADAGGWTAVRRPVDEIVVRRGRVEGVNLADGQEISCKRVISAAGAVQTARMLGRDLPGTNVDAYRKANAAHVSLYLGFKGDIASAGANRWCQWYYGQWELDAKAWDVAPGAVPEDVPVLFCSFPSLKDPRHDPGPEMRHTGETITFVPWDAFARWDGTRWQKRPEDYDEFKQELTDAMLKAYLKHYPDMADMIDHAEMSTPVSTNHFTDALQGSIYGLNTEPARFADLSLGPRTSIKGLFMGGQDAMAPGIVGALNGGALAAVAAEPVAAGRYLAPIIRPSRT